MFAYALHQYEDMIKSFWPQMETVFFLWFVNSKQLPAFSRIVWYENFLAIIYYRGVCVAIYEYLNSVFAADQDTSNKTREKTKGDKKKVQAAGMYINCLFKMLLVIHNSN